MPDESEPRKTRGSSIRVPSGSVLKTNPTKRRSSSTHRQSGRMQKAQKLIPERTPPPAPINANVLSTPSVTDSGLPSDQKIYSDDIETLIIAECRGVTRKNIP